MALQTYSELLSAIDSYSMWPGSPNELFVELAEEALRPLLKHRLMEKHVVLSAPAGASPELPTDFQEARAILLNGSALRPLSFHQLTPNSVGYVVTGDSLEVRPAPATDYSVDLYYYAKLPALSNQNPTNWLLTNFPTVYLRACLAQLYHWAKDPAAEQAEKDLTSDALSAVVKDHNRSTMYGNTIIEELSSW